MTKHIKQKTGIFVNDVKFENNNIYDILFIEGDKFFRKLT